jgi:hypothetical protein
MISPAVVVSAAKAQGDTLDEEWRFIPSQAWEKVVVQAKN